jgi:hypothetical protein
VLEVSQIIILDGFIGSLIINVLEDFKLFLILLEYLSLIGVQDDLNLPDKISIVSLDL